MNTPVLQTQALSKRYGGGQHATLALDNLNLTTEQGEIFGFLGPNGAGKTTTIKLLLDLIRPTGGHAAIFGMDVNAQSVDVRKRIGYLPGELDLWNDQRASRIIEYYGKLRGGANAAFVHELQQRLDFDPGRKFREYSSGNKRKLGLILALMHKPDLLILDEPTSGLDPLVQQTFLQLMREAREGGQSVFLSSHVLSEVQAICDRVGILRDGKLEEVKRVSELMQQDYRVVIVRLRDPAPASLFTALPFVSGVKINGREAQFHLTGPFNPLLDALRGVYVEDLDVVEPSLEDIFLTYYGDHPTNGAVNPAHKQALLEVAS